MVIIMQNKATKERTRGIKMLSRPEFDRIPESVKKPLQEFIDSISSVKFMRPYSDSKDTWVVSRADDWGKAREAAYLRAAHEARSSDKTYKDRPARVAESYDAILNMDRMGAFGVSLVAAESAITDAMNEVFDEGPSYVSHLDRDNIIADALLDAKQYIRYTLSKDLIGYGKEKDQMRVEGNWEVWKKGYGLAGRVNGKLFVYRIDDILAPLPKIRK